MRRTTARVGARKMHAMLNRPEESERHGLGHVARCTVERLMRAMGLHGIRRAKSPRTTRSAPKEQCPADLVKRHFSAFRPNELWACGHHLRTHPVRLGVCGLCH
ncbi:IS3 family transposase [Actinomyces qiguomingii]|uniref:IS3 family transposase n=2 Tax=Actinomyces qiguomingii TaxID=2057800 RepID=UPI000CA0612D